MDRKQMDQKPIVIYLAMKELSAVAIHHDLRATLGPEAVNYLSMIHCLRQAIFISSKSPANIPETEPQFDDSDQAILLALTERPFRSIRELAQMTLLPRTTLHRRLIQSFRFRVRHLRWVLHLLSHSQNSIA
jgi:hypothetical protein